MSDSLFALLQRELDQKSNSFCFMGNNQVVQRCCTIIKKMCNFVASMNEQQTKAEVLKPYHRITNRLGMALSLLCAIHCISMPFLAVSLPFLGSYFESNPWIEYLLLGSGLVLGGGITVHNYFKHHRNLPVLLVVLSGFGFLFLAHFFHHHWVETPIVAMGAILVAFGLYYNHKYANHVCKTCKVPHAH